MGKSKHDQVAEQLAKKFGTEYYANKGIDIRLPDRVIEVEVKKSTLNQGLEQLSSIKKKRYLAVTKNLVKEAVNMTKGTGIGVMDEKGKTMKKASR